MRILLAEDDDAIANALQRSLVDSGHVVNRTSEGSAADAALRDGDYDLLVLDLGLPRMDGTEIARRARARGNEVPILVITARDALGERVQLLDEGADDYLVKPFALVEFAARVRALLRRRSQLDREEKLVGGLRVSLTRPEAWVRERALELSAREFALLSLLAARVDRLVTRVHLIDALCGWDEGLTDNGLDIAMHRLRRKLAGSGAQVRTVRGLGYVLEEPGDVASA